MAQTRAAIDSGASTIPNSRAAPARPGWDFVRGAAQIRAARPTAKAAAAMPATAQFGFAATAKGSKVWLEDKVRSVDRL